MLHCRVSQGPLTWKPAATSLYVQAKFPHQIVSAAQAFAWWPSQDDYFTFPRMDVKQC